MTNIKQELEKINQSMAAAPAATQLNHISLFPGITLCFITFQTDHLQQRITIDELSRQYPINPTTLKQVFKSVYGTSIAAYVTQCRMTHAAKLLRSTDAPLSEIAHEVGYSSQSKFSAAFKKQHQILPSDYRRNP